MPKDLTDYIASAYSSMGKEEAKCDAPHSYTTSRTLLSMFHIAVVIYIFFCEIT